MTDRPTRERLDEIVLVLQTANDDGPSERYLLKACADLLREIDALAVDCKNAMSPGAFDYFSQARDRLERDLWATCANAEAIATERDSALADARLLAAEVSQLIPAAHRGGLTIMPSEALALALARHAPRPEQSDA